MAATPDCPGGCERGWVCEEHAHAMPGHDGCDGAGAPCQDRRCPYWQGDQPLALNSSVLFDEVYASRRDLPTRAGRMLKALRHQFLRKGRKRSS